MANVRGLRGLKSIVRERYYFFSGCVEGLLANAMILGQELWGDVWEFS